MTSIEWTDEVWNVVTGCSKVSPGCDNCYAEALAVGRLAGTRGYPGLPWTPENARENVVLRPERLDKPTRWREPRMVFVNSMSDLFHPRVPSRFLVDVFAVMAACPQHTFQVLTKRPKRMRDWCLLCWPEPLPNVWLGTSIESREWVGRADLLREVPAAVRFISAEPLLGPLVYDDWTVDGEWIDGKPIRYRHWRDDVDVPELDLAGIDWVIVGGESGPRHRPMNPQWARDLRDAVLRTRPLCPDCDHGLRGGEPCPAPGCREGRVGGTAFFFKQHGGRTPKTGGRELDGETWDEYPMLFGADEPNDPAPTTASALPGFPS